MRSIPWSKIAPPLLAIVGGWLGPRIYRAVKNLSKTEQKLAEEELEAAVKRAEDAHANADPADDVAADAAVAQAKKHREKAARLGALADALTDPDAPSPPK